MVESNHAALGEGIRLYQSAMRRFLQERLTTKYGSRAWDHGAWAALSDPQRNALKRELEKEPGRDRWGHLEAGHFVRIVTKEFDNALAGVFSAHGFADFKKTQSWLQQVATARNEWAHPRTGDMLADEVAHYLYSMAQLLTASGLGEADKMEQLRKDVLGIEDSPTPAPMRSIKPAGSGELPYWWQVCEPHDGFQNPAAIDESLFAATLGGVHAGSARREYADPSIFFSHTYFTENLKQIIRDVASRLSGGDGPAVTEMQTPFGGGKTHALLTLYHLIQHPKESLAVPGVSEALGDISIPANARVLAFDGMEYSTEPVEKENGATIFTLWGELAFQAGSHLFTEYILPLDSRGEAPGNAIFRQVLQAASPCLILIDELVNYLIGLRFSNTRRTQNQYQQTLRFIQELLQEAGNVPGVCVLLSLPKSRREFGGLDPAELQRQLGVLDELQARADRVVTKRTPVSDDEVYTLMSKRLFKRVDREAAARVARTYRETYERTRALYEPTVFSAEYLQAQIDAYPLNPELIDVLYKKWSTAADFPRTRAVLQLLAGVVADQWVNRREAYSIQSGHVNLERERIRTRIVSAAGSGGGYDGVIAADIIGGDAHADHVDQEHGGDYARHHIARGVATTLLMHSFGGAERLGAYAPELRLGSVAPNVGPEYLTDVLASLEQTLWFVHREGERLRFQVRPNIFRMIAQQAEQQPKASVLERLRAEMSKATGTAEGFRVAEWAGGDGTIADRPEPVIAILEPRYAVSQPNGNHELEGRAPIDQLWERVGGGLRRWRNALVLIAPDGELWAKAEDAVREVMGYETVIDNAKKNTVEVSPAELRDLESRLKDKQGSLVSSAVTAYRWAFYPEEAGLASLGLAVPAIKGEQIAKRAVERLSDQNYGQPKVLYKMSAIYFNSKLAPQLWKDETAPLELSELSRRFQEWTYLPILPKREETLLECIREGVKQGLWAVAIGDCANLKFDRLVENPDQLTAFVNLFDGSACLLKGGLLELVRETLTPGVQPPIPPGPKPAINDGPGVTYAPTPPPPVIPAPTRRLTRLKLRLTGLGVAKTGNLQPYLFKVLQEQDAAAELSMTLEVKSGAGIPVDVLEKRIVEGFEQLGITVQWEEG